MNKTYLEKYVEGEGKKYIWQLLNIENSVCNREFALHFDYSPVYSKLGMY